MTIERMLIKFDTLQLGADTLSYTRLIVAKLFIVIAYNMNIIRHITHIFTQQEKRIHDFSSHDALKSIGCVTNLGGNQLKFQHTPDENEKTLRI